MRTSRWGSGRQRGGSGGTDTRCTAAPAGCVSRTQTAVAPEDFVPFRKFSILLCSPLARLPRPCGWFTSERSRLLGHTRPGLGASCCPRSLCPRRWAHSLPSRVPASLRPLPPPRRDVHRHSPCHRPPGPTWAALHGIVLGPRPRPDPSVQGRGRPPGASGEREAGTTPLWRWLRPHGRHRSTPRCPGSATHRPPAVTAVADTGTVRPRWSTTPVTANHVNLLSRGQKMSRCHEGHTCAPGWRGGKYQGLSPWGGLSGCTPPWKSPCRVWGRRCHGRTFPPASGRNGSAVSSGHAGDGPAGARATSAPPRPAGEAPPLRVANQPRLPGAGPCVAGPRVSIPSDRFCRLLGAFGPLTRSENAGWLRLNPPCTTGLLFVPFLFLFCHLSG